jgi:L-serine dehydratase
MHNAILCCRKSTLQYYENSIIEIQSLLSMESIREIYKIGHGPSSSHTMGPKKAAEIFREGNPEAASYRVTLYSSLAATGKGHLTDVVLLDAFKPKQLEIIWKPEESLPYHPNAMKFGSLDNKGSILSEWIVYSVGGGNIVDDIPNQNAEKLYSLNKMSDILEWTEKSGKTLWEYVGEMEGSSIWDYLYEVWEIMKLTIKRGLENEGVLPGNIHLQRKASAYSVKAGGYKGSLRRRSLLFAYALAVSEENASGGRIVTAPTCGSCGVLPAVMYLLHENYRFSDQKIVRAIATAGLVGNLVKTSASISGADVGCQGEIGTACAMAAGAAAQLFGGSPFQVEYAAEMGLEHHLGLTCDPVSGLVQIPCIERNAFAASRALDASTYSLLSDGKHRISFDRIVMVMKQTGHDLPSLYKETAEGGLAISFT